jgi:hypothetical protein
VGSEVTHKHHEVKAGGRWSQAHTHHRMEVTWGVRSKASRTRVTLRSMSDEAFTSIVFFDGRIWWEGEAIQDE